MNQLIRSSLFLSLLLNSILAFSEPKLTPNKHATLSEHSSGWTHKENSDGISIHTQHYKDSDFKAFKAIATIESSIESIFAVISDPTSCPLWVDNCLESYSYPQPSQENPQFNNRYGFALSHLPWPFKNRDLIVNIITSNNPETNEITITMSSDKNLISKSDDTIHITHQLVKYILRPKNKSQTELIWMQHTEPAGDLPAWLVNKMITDLPVNSISKLKDVSKQKKYQEAIIEYDSQKQIQGLKLDIKQ